MFHLDAPNLVLTSLRPAAPPEGVSAAVIATLLESSTFGGAAELRCPKNPSRAMTIDSDGNANMELTIKGDAVALDVPAGELLRVRVEFA